MYSCVYVHVYVHVHVTFCVYSYIRNLNRYLE